MNKQLEFSALVDGTLIERPTRTISGGKNWSIDRMSAFDREYGPHEYYRIALDVWHFNDGSMVLPDGLIVDWKARDGDIYNRHTVLANYITDPNSKICMPLIYDDSDPKRRAKLLESIAVKVLGVHADYAEDGKLYGMGVIEI